MQGKQLLKVETEIALIHLETKEHQEVLWHHRNLWEPGLAPRPEATQIGPAPLKTGMCPPGHLLQATFLAP